MANCTLSVQWNTTRHTIGASLEARAPLLNKNVIRYSSYFNDENSPLEEFLNKRKLRELLYDKLDKRLFDRPKTGFSVPYKKLVDGKIKKFFLEESIIKDNSSFRSKSFELVHNYYNGNHQDYKFVWNFYCFLRWEYKILQI